MTILLLLVGLGLIVLGADWLVDGASAIARKVGVSEFVIGLTIVGFGASCPELVVSLTGALQGNADISIGNVVGSNIFNTLFILGLTSLILPVSMTKENRRRDIPITLGVSLLLILCGMSHSIFGIGQSDGISRTEGIFFLFAFAAYLFYCFKFDSKEQFEREEQKSMKIPTAILLVAFGLAGGTSLPELATSIVAASKHKDQLALGNILGSNVFNILLILGCSAVITPLSFAGMNPVDAGALILSSVLLLVWAFTGRKCRIDRWEGAIMLLVFVAYYYYLFTQL